MDTGFWVLQLFNALQYSMLRFLLSIGLTVIFGLLHFVNLAHGALYMMRPIWGCRPPSRPKASGPRSYWPRLGSPPLVRSSVYRPIPMRS